MNLLDYKVPVFPGINDVPRVPTAQQAGNGSDLVARFNSILEEIERRTRIKCTITTVEGAEIDEIYIFYANYEPKLDIDPDTGNDLPIQIEDRALIAKLAIAPGAVVDLSDRINATGCGYFYLVPAYQGVLSTSVTLAPLNQDLLGNATFNNGWVPISVVPDLASPTARVELAQISPMKIAMLAGTVEVQVDLGVSIG